MQRNFGLDLMRAAAIVMVMASHTPYPFRNKEAAFLYGVDLFFALSGFLIAQMIVERFDSISSWAAFKAFMLNRWLRILPLYYLILAAFLVFAALTYPPGWKGGSFISPWRYIFFVQDLTDGRPNDHGYSTFFIVAWSLSVEEFFYLGCPILALLAGRWRRSLMFWCLVGVTITSAMICARLWVYLNIDHGMLLLDASYRRATILRLDAFVYGAAIYWLSQNGFFTRILALLATTVGAYVLVLSGTLYAVVPNGAFSKVWMLSLLPMGCALLIPAAMNLRAPRLIIATARFLSTRAYALYLVHLLVSAVLFLFAPVTTLNYLWSLALSAILANLLHITVERPFMALRPRFVVHPLSVPAPAE
jgi:peptidoglycan/LPS O-acetylase OafA/YrhL